MGKTKTVPIRGVIGALVFICFFLGKITGKLNFDIVGRSEMAVLGIWFGCGLFTALLAALCFKISGESELNGHLEIREMFWFYLLMGVSGLGLFLYFAGIDVLDWVEEKLKLLVFLLYFCLAKTKFKCLNFAHTLLPLGITIDE